MIPLPPALARFQAKAHQLVMRRGFSGADAQDLVAWMVLDWLEHPAIRLNVHYCLSHALDHLYPRRGDGEDRRRYYRIRDYIWSAPPPASPDPLLQATLLQVCTKPSQKRALRLALLHYGYGWSQADLAREEGVDHSRVCHLLRELCVRLRIRLASLAVKEEIVEKGYSLGNP